MQTIIGTIPIIWLIAYLGFVLFQGNLLIWKVTFILFFVAFHSIWILCAITLILSVIRKKFIFEKKGILVFALGAALFVIIFTFDPGGYLYLLLD
jgi:hypothetical protein